MRHGWRVRCKWRSGLGGGRHRPWTQPDSVDVSRSGARAKCRIVGVGWSGAKGRITRAKKERKKELRPEYMSMTSIQHFAGLQPSSHTTPPGPPCTELLLPTPFPGRDGNFSSGAGGEGLPWDPSPALPIWTPCPHACQHSLERQLRHVTDD